MASKRKSQLEMNNELVNKEMKSLFNVVSKKASAPLPPPPQLQLLPLSAPSLSAADYAVDEKDETTTTSVAPRSSFKIIDEVEGEAVATKGGATTTSANNGPTTSITIGDSDPNNNVFIKHQQNQLKQQQQQSSNVNFGTAVYNKNFIALQTMQQQQQQQQHNESVETDSSMFNSNLSSTVDGSSLIDDLSMLPIIDDKTLLSAIKAKFESKKFYVSITTRLTKLKATNFRLIDVFFLTWILHIELHWRATHSRQLARERAHLHQRGKHKSYFPETKMTSSTYID